MEEQQFSLPVQFQRKHHEFVPLNLNLLKAALLRASQCKEEFAVQMLQFTARFENKNSAKERIAMQLQP